MIEASHFVAINVAALFGASSAAVAVGARRESWRVLLIGVVTYGLIAHFVVLLLGMTGNLTPSAGLLMTCTIGAILALVARRNASRPIGFREQSSDTPVDENSLLLPIAAMLLCGAIAPQVLEAGFQASHLKWDDLSYHGTVAAQWLVDGQFSIVPSTYQIYYPFGAELLSLWFMLPFKDDTYVSLAGFYWMILASSSIYGIVRGSGSSPAVGMLITAAFLASPKLVGNIVGSIGSFSVNDLAGAALVIAAIAVVQPSEHEGQAERRVELVLSGLLAGMAVGCKVAYAPAVFILLCWLVVSRDRFLPGVSRWSIFLLYSAMALAAGGYWYARNLFLTGNPLFPAGFGPLWGPFDAETQTRTTAWYWLVRDGIPFSQLKRLIQWPLLTGLVAFSGYAMLFFELARRFTGKISSRVSQVEGLLFVVGILTVVIFPILPFSGTSNRPGADVVLSTRYLMLAIVIGIILYRRLLGLSGNWHYASLALLLSAYLTSKGWFRGNSLVIFAAFLFGVLAAWRYHYWQRHWPIFTFVAGAIFFTMLAASVEGKREATSRELYAYDGVEDPIGKAWAFLEKLPSGSRIAFYMSEPDDYTQTYPLFGRDLQLQPSYVDGDGLLRRPIHEVSTERSVWWSDWLKSEHGWGRTQPNVSREKFVHNLIDADVDFVLLSMWSLGHWPPQAALIRDTALTKEIYNDGYSSIWQINRAVRTQ